MDLRANKNLTAERLRELLDYDPSTGVFTWRVCRRNRNSFEGKAAGVINASGGIIIKINYVLYHAARLAWLHHHGSWPECFVDHINRNRADNRIDNLREATPAQNSQNQKRSRNNSSGFNGVNFVKATGKWRAIITSNRQVHFLGGFPTKEEAISAYREACQRLHGDFAHHD